METYYVNKRQQANGEHEVHKQGCLFFPGANHAQLLGTFTNCRDAVAEARRKYYEKSNGCRTCARECDEG